MVCPQIACGFQDGKLRVFDIDATSLLLEQQQHRAAVLQVRATAQPRWPWRYPCRADTRAYTPGSAGVQRCQLFATSLHTPHSHVPYCHAPRFCQQLLR